MIKIDDHAQTDLDQLANDHYNRLIGTLLLDGVNYHSTQSLIGRIRRQRDIDAAIPDQTRVDFWDYLLDNSFTKLKQIITGRPSVLRALIKEIENKFGAAFFSINLNYNKASVTPFGEIIKTVFNYNLYRSTSACRDNCDQFRLSYCPYCNEQTTQIITLINGLTGLNEKRALLQLDHFYPQSRHPYLSVSFFNMIPGCTPCNTHLKQEKNFDILTHFNPFDKRLDDYFAFELGSVLLQSEDDVQFSYVNKSVFPNNSIVDFKIINRYVHRSHKRMIFNFFQTFKNHSSKVNRSLAAQIKGLFTTDSKKILLLDMYNVPTKRNEINDVQLGKLKRDIAIQLGVLKKI
ncbi:MAG: hypothetical protein JNM21_03585 [Taibaiella sp.]|nr:hypothetical protein [Taibaiella sp.]